jgi:hypothetical protein
MIYEIWMPGYLAPSLNELMRRRSHHVRATQKRECSDWLVAYGVGDLPQYEGPVTVEYCRIRSRGREMDSDNLYGSFKMIGDALEHLGVVENDRLIDLKATQELGKVSGTRLRFSPCTTQTLPATEPSDVG